jgi:hypothetical protein
LHNRRVVSVYNNLDPVSFIFIKTSLQVNPFISFSKHFDDSSFRHFIISSVPNKNMQSIRDQYSQAVLNNPYTKTSGLIQLVSPRCAGVRSLLRQIIDQALQSKEKLNVNLFFVCIRQARKEQNLIEAYFKDRATDISIFRLGRSLLRSDFSFSDKKSLNLSFVVCRPNITLRGIPYADLNIVNYYDTIPMSTRKEVIIPFINTSPRQIITRGIMTEHTPTETRNFIRLIEEQPDLITYDFLNITGLSFDEYADLLRKGE